VNIEAGMSKPLNKGGTEKLSIPIIKLPSGNQYQTRAATQATNTTKTALAHSRDTSSYPKEVQESRDNAAKNSKEKAPNTDKKELTTLQTITKAINIIIVKVKLEKKVKTWLKDIVKFISNVEKKKRGVESSTRQSEVSTLYKAIR
jgi:hypothetical protein